MFMSTSDLSLGELVRKLRVEAGMSTHKLAELAGVNQSNISRLELGQAPRSTMSSLTRIAEVLGIDPARLYKAAGITDADAALPSLRPYLRSKYSHLPKAKVEELVAFFETIEAEQAAKRKRK
jgi:transcriptional regulator with XRE-family HTH domain